MNRKTLGTILKTAYCVGIAAATILLSLRDSKANFRNEAVIEAGSPIRIGDFFTKVPDDAEFISSLSSIDTSVPSIYKLKLHYDFLFNETVTLRIEDNTGPTAEGLTRNIMTYDEIPAASEMVGKVYDISGISSIEYVKEPDISEGGIIYVPVRLTDNYGNSSTVEARLVVTKDTTPPKIYGVTDIKTVAGQNPDLTKDVFATDNVTKNVPVRIDASKLKYETPGVYEIYYQAEDDAGNTATATSTVTVTKKRAAKRRRVRTQTKTAAKKPSYASVDKLAENLLKKLKKNSNVETARAIFKWVHKNIHYVHTASKATGKKAAYIGLTRHAGNCRVYAYTCKLLLDKAGIKNMIVQRYPVTTRHFWNLVYMSGGWYHCDATPFRDHRGLYFKLTDKQLDKHHKFKKNKYPERAKK